MIVGEPALGGSSNSSSQKNCVREPRANKFHLIGNPLIVFREDEVEHWDPDYDDAIKNYQCPNENDPSRYEKLR